VLLGPTACGKTAVAVRLAAHLGLDVISCDSRQVYRYMDIGTAKPEAEQLRAAKHWLIDIVDPSEYYSAFGFARDAGALIRTLHEQGRAALVCGGTGFYFRCLSEGLGPQGPADAALRERYYKKVEQQGSESIFEELEALDPQYAGRIHPSDTRRVVRALEIYHTTGNAVSDLKQHTRPPEDFEFRIVALTLPRAELYRRINDRVTGMARRGLWDEFQGLRDRGFNEESPGMLCVGYHELFDVEKGEASLPDALEKVKRNTRRYAKKQLTWLRHQLPASARFMEPGGYEGIRSEFERFLAGAPSAASDQS